MSTLDLQVIRFLGEGTGGKVYLVKDQLSRARIALKVVAKQGKNSHALSVVLKERRIAEKLSDSPWFVELWAAWGDQRNFYIAMTIYPTDLDSEMLRCGTIEPDRARFYMAEIVIALTELHSRGIIHRDVKAPNILLDFEGHIVLADFGLSKDFGERPTIAERVFQPYWPFLRIDNATSETPPRNPEELFFVTWDYRGSELEMAPEVHLRKPYSFGVDFWSAAVVLYWMLTGRPPFYVGEDEIQFVGQGESKAKSLAQMIAEDPLYWDPEDNVDDITRDFLEKMMEKDPSQRLMISYEMLNHPYFSETNWTLMEQRKVPPLWIPPRGVCHVHEPTSPSFTPGEPYTEDTPDPYPEFNFISQRLTEGFTCDDLDDGLYDHIEQENRPEPITDAPTFDLLHTDEYFHNHGFIPSSRPCSLATLKSDFLGEGMPDKAAYELLEPKVHQERLSFEHVFEQPARIKDRGISDNGVFWQPAPPGLGIWSQSSNLPLKLDLDRAFGLHTIYLSSAPQIPRRRRGQCSGHSSATSSTYSSSNFQHSQRVVNGTGILFKMKVWMARLWPKKPKKIQHLKRLSLLA